MSLRLIYLKCFFLSMLAYLYQLLGLKSLLGITTQFFNIASKSYQFLLYLNHAHFGLSASFLEGLYFFFFYLIISYHFPHNLAGSPHPPPLCQIFFFLLFLKSCCFQNFAFFLLLLSYLLFLRNPILIHHFIITSMLMIPKCMYLVLPSLPMFRFG